MGERAPRRAFGIREEEDAVVREVGFGSSLQERSEKCRVYEDGFGFCVFDLVDNLYFRKLDS